MGVEQFVIHCGCGASLKVGMHRCGLDETCPRCRKTTRVPDLLTLRSMAGDRHPMLSPIDKIRQAIAEKQSPFDGKCASCGLAATTEVPIIFSELRERVVADNGGIRVGLTGVSAVVGASEEVIERTSIPLNLCEGCHGRFQHDRPSRAFRRLMDIFLIVVIGAIMLTVAIYLPGLNLKWVLVPVLMGMVWHWNRKGSSRDVQRFGWLQPWVEKIPWLTDAADSAMESAVAAGRGRPIQ